MISLPYSNTMDPKAYLYGAILFLYVVLRPVYTRLIRKLLSLTKTNVDDRLFSAVEMPLWLAIFLLLLDILVTDLYPSGLVHGIMLTLVIFLIVLALLRAGRILIYEVALPAGVVKADEKTLNTVKSVLTNIYAALILFFGFIYVLSLWNVDITPLIASAGLFGIVMGLALKDPLENLISGVLLLLDPPFRVGDIVRIGDLVGEVKEIGMRNTKILTFDGDLVTLPNSIVIKNEVEDFHLPNERVRVRIRVGVSYDSDPDHVKRILLDIASSHPLVLKDPEPQALFLELGDFALIFELRVWTELPNKMQVLSDLNTEIIKRFREEGIEIPFPIRTVYLKES